MPDSTLTRGDMCGEYILIKSLGKGGEAYTWMAIKADHPEAQLVALRILKKQEENATDDIKRHFEREKQMYKRLRGCPHIISLQDSNWNDGEPYLVMPYISGGSLKDVLENTTSLSFEERLTYIKQMAEALICIHSKGIMHRDVNPKNLLLDRDRILLCDFGLAIDAAATPPETRGTWGTGRYKAPEQKEGNPCQASDQYALAIILCELLTGKYPWDGDCEAGERDLRATKYPGIAEVFKKASHEKPEDRYEAMEVFLEELNKATGSGRAELAVLARNGLLENNGGDEKEHDAQVHQPSLQEPVVNRVDHLQESNSQNPPTRSLPETPLPTPETMNLSNGDQPPTRPERHRASLLVRIFCVALLLLSIIILTADDIHLHLLNNTLVAPTPNQFTVTSLEDDDPGSLRQAIIKAQKLNRSIITFASSLQGEGKLNKDLEIPANVAIEAPKAHQIALTPQNSTIKIHVPQGINVSFGNIDFQGKNGPRMDAFLINEGNLFIINSRISNFQSRSNGILNNKGGTFTCTQCEVDHNQTLENGGGTISNAGGTVILDNSKVHDNQASYAGGGIYSINGNIFIRNHSFITDNHVLSSLSDGGLGGGGGMTIHGGTVSIFDTTITHNTSQGNGGGILLVGASAQIAHSFIQNNETNTTQAGGIAVEANTENSYTSFLVLTDNTVVQPNSNVNAQSSPLFAVNIDGQIVGQDAATMSIKSGPPKSPGATSSPQFLGNLKSEDFQKYCQKPPFTKTTVSSDAQTITCASVDGVKLVLSSQNRQVELVCAMLHPKAKFIHARLFRSRTGKNTCPCHSRRAAPP